MTPVRLASSAWYVTVCANTRESSESASTPTEKKREPIAGQWWGVWLLGLRVMVLYRGTGARDWLHDVLVRYCGSWMGGGRGKGSAGLQVRAIIRAWAGGGGGACSGGGSELTAR